MSISLLPCLFSDQDEMRTLCRGTRKHPFCKVYFQKCKWWSKCEMLMTTNKWVVVI